MQKTDLRCQDCYFDRISVLETLLIAPPVTIHIVRLSLWCSLMLRLAVRGIYILVRLGSSLAIRSSSFAVVSCLVPSWILVVDLTCSFLRGAPSREILRPVSQIINLGPPWKSQSYSRNLLVNGSRGSGAWPGGSSKAREILNPLLFLGKRVSFSYYLIRHRSWANM